MICQINQPAKLKPNWLNWNMFANQWKIAEIMDAGTPLPSSATPAVLVCGVSMYAVSLWNCVLGDDRMSSSIHVHLLEQ